MVNIDNRLLDMDLTPNEVVVLLHIGKRINRKRISFPSIKLLQKEVGIGRDSVQKAIKGLVDKGVLEKAQLKEKGKFSRTIYKITTKYLGVYISADGVEMEDTPLTEIPSTVLPSTVLPSTENQTLSIDHNRSIDQKEVKPSSEDEELSFEKFYSKYPRKKGKKAAERAFNRLSNKNKKLAIDGIDGFVEGKEMKFIKYPASYLNGEHWNDEQTATEKIIRKTYPSGKKKRPKYGKYLSDSYLKNELSDMNYSYELISYLNREQREKCYNNNYCPKSVERNLEEKIDEIIQTMTITSATIWE